MTDVVKENASVVLAHVDLINDVLKEHGLIDGNAPPPQPPDPPDPTDPPPSDQPCKHPQFEYVVEGSCVDLGGVVHNTRKRNKTQDTSEYFQIGQRNGTCTQIDKISKGRVKWEAYYENGVLEVGGGGKHFHEVMSYVADRAGQFRPIIRDMDTIRIELANLGDRPRCIVWNYDADFDGRASLILGLGEALPETQWIPWELAWDYNATTGKVRVEVVKAGRTFSATADVTPGSQGPGRFWLPLGHVETATGNGGVRFRNVSWS